MRPRTQNSSIPRERTGASQVGENPFFSSMRLVTVIPYLNVMQMLAPRISADAGIRSWEMVEESKPTCQEEPLPCHRFPPSAQMHDTLLRCSARRILCPCYLCRVSFDLAVACFRPRPADLMPPSIILGLSQIVDRHHHHIMTNDSAFSKLSSNLIDFLKYKVPPEF